MEGNGETGRICKIKVRRVGIGTTEGCEYKRMKVAWHERKRERETWNKGKILDSLRYGILKVDVECDCSIWIV